MVSYFSSDWHLGHDKEFIWKERGFASLADHNTAVLAAVDAIRPGDELFFLGDMAMTSGKREIIADVFARCKGTIVFCKGNHDPTMDHLLDLAKRAGENKVTIALTYSLERAHYLLGHYPPRAAEGESHNAHAFDAPEYIEGARILHGHTHSKSRVSPLGAINVAWDAWGRFPSLEDLKAL